MFKGIEPRQGFKQSFEGQASFFQEAHVRVAVRHQFFLEIKHLLFGTLLLMPLFQFLLGFGGHGRDGSHVRLVFGEVELVREVALAEFRQSKGFVKGRQRHLEETERIDETNAIVLDF